jgi:hypothetical protein
MGSNIISRHKRKKDGKKRNTKKRPDLGEGRERAHVLFCMFVTFPTSHVERSPLKEPAYSNTAPQQQQRKVQGQKWVEKKRGESNV